jgi:3-deoxy-D-manno-octulosonic-acid transferase
LAPASDAKVWKSLRARRGLIGQWRAQARAVRDLSRPLVWLHAPSVGEGLQARPVAHALRAAHPEWQLAYSFFSPSAEAFARSVGADITGYLPFDTADAAEQLLDMLRPAALVFVKLDLWPVLAERTQARGIPVAMLSATLAEGSGRRGRWAQLLTRDAYASLAAVGAIDAAHGERLCGLGVPRSVLQVTGDTRFDQVAERAMRVNHIAPPLSLLTSTRPTLVAGSTWPADEAVLLPAWRDVHARVREARLIIAPHEPTAGHCAPIVTWARDAGLTLRTLSDIERAGHDDTTDVVLVDRVGVLGDLYALAQVAYVGGGFHAAGLHSAIEPAAFGAPVVFGPRHDMSREAGLLLAAGGARSVSDENALAAQLTSWLTDAGSRQTAGAAARAVVEQERGATERSRRLVESLVTR